MENLIGLKFDYFTIIEDLGYPKDPKIRMVKVNCICGIEIKMHYTSLCRSTKQRIKSCGCKDVIKKLTDLVFGDLTVVKDLGWINHRRMVRVECSCGNQKEMRYDSLIRSKSRSELKKPKHCGCKFGIRNKKGIIKDPLYQSWYDAKARCQDSNNKGYHNYGGRGITIAERWLTYSNFHTDLIDLYNQAKKDNPEKQISIDRIDNNGNYEPGNIKFSTKYEQGRNRRTNIVITHNQETKILLDWCKFYNLSYTKVRDHYHRGKPFVEILKFFGKE